MKNQKWKNIDKQIMRKNSVEERGGRFKGLEVKWITISFKNIGWEVDGRKRKEKLIGKRKEIEKGKGTF